MDVSGSGNNFAHGFYSYGPQYRQNFEEGLRKNAEHCDSLQTFLVLLFTDVIVTDADFCTSFI
jgi:hypothetical protein